MATQDVGWGQQTVMADNEMHIVRERENVIYGAGVFGRRLWEFFRELPVPIHFFVRRKKKVILRK